MGLISIVCLDNVRMIELGRRMNLAVKALDRVGAGQSFLANDLESDDPAHPVMPRLEDGPHAALAEALQNDVIAET